MTSNHHEQTGKTGNMIAGLVDYVIGRVTSDPPSLKEAFDRRDALNNRTAQDPYTEARLTSEQKELLAGYPRATGRTIRIRMLPDLHEQ